MKMRSTEKEEEEEKDEGQQSYKRWRRKLPLLPRILDNEEKADAMAMAVKNAAGKSMAMAIANA